MNQCKGEASLLKMAIVPWEEAYEGDRLFDLTSDVNQRDNVGMVFFLLKQKLEEQGWIVHTIDLFSSIRELDAIVFFRFDIVWYKMLRKAGQTDKTIYMAWEPPVVDPNHSDNGLKRLLHYFKYILTWNDAVVDNNRIHKFMYPYYFEPERSDLPFQERKLLVNISGNKQSNAENELYSERKRVIDFFDEDSEFSLYGTNWEKDQYRSYRGKAENKKEVYHHFKFALSLENMKNVDGYITEKILDCFCAGIVPIYWGARNIDYYIPEECYIPYGSFSSLGEMKSFLERMNERDYQKYLDAAADFIRSDGPRIFSVENLANTLVDLSKNLNGISFRKYPLLIYQINLLCNKVARKVAKLLGNR